MENSIIDTIGCDLGDKTSILCILHPDGEKERHKVRTTRAAIRKFFGERPPAHVILEVGTHSRWVNELLTELGHRVTVANPRKTQLISMSDSKSDTHDADLLARLGRVDVMLLHPIQHRSRACQADLAIAKSRDALVACRTQLVNHVRGTVKSMGERLSTCTAESFARRTLEELPVELQPALLPTYQAIEALDAQIKELDRTIVQTAKKYPEIDLLMQPSGVGVLTAFVYLLTLEDKSRFTKSRNAGAFLGLRPRRSQSGDGDPQLRITKAGDPFLRRLLVNSANYILGPFGQDCDLRRWGLRLAERGGKNARKRAKVAVARKLAVLLHRLWVTGEVYQPIGYRQERRAA